MIDFKDKLLQDLGTATVGTRSGGTVHAAELWAASGLMTLTGTADGKATLCPVPLAQCADDSLDVLRQLTGIDILPGVAGHQLLTERAALSGLRRRGPHSTGGHCRLLRSADGVVAVNLARDTDWELLPAWLERTACNDWSELESLVATRRSSLLLERARLLGLAVADATRTPRVADSWHSTAHIGKRMARAPARFPVVVDLTALWAGPLCSHLWQQAGARVIKVESERRPDGSRYGAPAFFDVLNAGKEQLTLPLHERGGRQALLDLIADADIVLESSRPRALRQMGVVAEDLLSTQPGLTWVSITGYGRGEPEGNWVAFGDDAGVAAGLSAILHAVTGQWLICADAIADPLTGLHAALAGWHYWASGGGTLVALSLEQTVRHCIVTTAPFDGDYQGRQNRWKAQLERGRVVPGAPRMRCNPV